jgi:hypothetical protein
MTDINLDCVAFDARLAAWLENDLDDAGASAMEVHAASCEGCGTLAADVRAIHARAASLPELTPSRDLWSGIEERIAAPVIPIGAPALVAGPGRQSAAASRRRTWLRPGIAAAALVIVTAGLTHLLESGVASRPASGATVASRPAHPTLDPHDTVGGSLAIPPAHAPGSPAGASAAATKSPAPARLLASAPTAAAPVLAADAEAYQLTGNLAVRNVEASYGREITRLRAIVDRNRGQLDTSTVRVLEHNLQVIDSAIVQCRRALQHDPGSRFLIESLDDALRSKVELLRTTATMSS